MALVALAAATPVRAQDTVRILVGFPPGGGADLIARLAADKARDALGAQVIVENRPGAGGQIAAEALKNAAPDGKTLMASPVAVTVIAPLTHKKLAYDPEKDFAPVSLAVNFQLAFTAGPATPATTLAEYIAWVKGDARRTSFGVPAAGSLPHFFGLLLGRAIGTELVHVPYKGGAPLLNDLIGGQIPAGDRRALGGDHAASRRQGAHPRELGRQALGRSHPRCPRSPSSAIRRSRATGGSRSTRRQERRRRRSTGCRARSAAAIRAPDVTERLLKIGFEPVGSSAEELARRMAEDRARWAPIVKASGFSVDQR